MRADQKTYLDFNSGAPLHPGVREELLKCLQDPQFHLSNPSSQHSYGQQAKKWIRLAKERVAHSLGAPAHAESLIFTGSESEANQTVILSEFHRAIAERKTFHWMLSEAEHASNLEMAETIRSNGGKVTFIPVDSNGRFQVDKMDEAFRAHRDSHQLLSLIWVNNETGVIQSFPELLAQLREGPNALRVHVDGAQAWGKTPFSLEEMPFDYATFSAHKIGGLSGVGILFARDPSRIRPLVRGKQQNQKRGGTENLLGIMACGWAAQAANAKAFGEITRPLKKHFEERLTGEMDGVTIHARDCERVPNTVNFRISGVRASQLIPALDIEGFAVSAGSACQSGLPEPSHVLRAMGLSNEQALEAVRVSFGVVATREQVDAFLDAIKRVSKRFVSSGRGSASA